MKIYDKIFINIESHNIAAVITRLCIDHIFFVKQKLHHGVSMALQIYDTNALFR